MNETVQNYVAEPVEMDAHLVQYDDWIVMYVKDIGAINRISGLSLLKNDADIFCCGENGNRQSAIVKQ